MSVCPSFRPSVRDNSAPTGRIFMQFDICVFVFVKSFGKIKVSLKYDKINEFFTNIYI